MGLKRKLLDAVKAGYPTFNEETDSFTIEFSGYGDGFSSFSSIDFYRHGKDWNHKFEGEFSVTDNEELLFEILEASGVEYNWNNAGTTGKISYQEDYQDGVLNVETVMSYESYGEVEDGEE